ncbi:hypothetical protein AXG93_1231s1260 [Marchantia polymorpha subsp. ruderalis]|uniref:Uncharacterized protein n=1 Tax=Marchantia polymorpha subsp. ruderalis TaxID=1480154 RepID=A0A176VRI5_MARPO|nr:hypothetical protein AXG93_1231s1260 [Marchantia polymorpha subsp. ruderalis]
MATTGGVTGTRAGSQKMQALSVADFLSVDYRIATKALDATPVAAARRKECRRAAACKHGSQSGRASGRVPWMGVTGDGQRVECRAARCPGVGLGLPPGELEAREANGRTKSERWRLLRSRSWSWWRRIWRESDGGAGRGEGKGSRERFPRHAYVMSRTNLRIGWQRGRRKKPSRPEGYGV